MTFSAGWALLIAVVIVVLLPDSKAKAIGALLLSPLVLGFLLRWMYVDARPVFDFTLFCIASSFLTWTAFSILRRAAMNDATWLPAAMSLSESEKNAVAERKEDPESSSFRIRWLVSVVIGLGLVLGVTELLGL